MAVYRDDKRGTWYVSMFVRDEFNIKRHKVRRGFASRSDALEAERRMKLDAKNGGRMLFQDLADIYADDMKKRVKRSTYIHKMYVIRDKILPTFRRKNVFEISAADVRKWQSNLMQGGYSPTYLRTIHAELSAMFNYAVRYYSLSRNPCKDAGSIGKGSAGEQPIWTIEEFYSFLNAIQDRPEACMAFLTLFWTGLRIGELLALTVEDVNLDDKTIRVNKSLQRLQGEDIITEPKTPRSNRVIAVPDVLMVELRRYITEMGDVPGDTRIIHMTKNLLERILKKGIRKVVGLKDIHPHCLRHSHTALIASLGATPVEAAERLGHENVTTTLNIYSHVLPGWQTEMARGLDSLFNQTMKSDEI